MVLSTNMLLWNLLRCSAPLALKTRPLPTSAGLDLNCVLTRRKNEIYRKHVIDQRNSSSFLASTSLRRPAFGTLILYFNLELKPKKKPIITRRRFVQNWTDYASFNSLCTLHVSAKGYNLNRTCRHLPICDSVTQLPIIIIPISWPLQVRKAHPSSRPSFNLEVKVQWEAEGHKPLSHSLNMETTEWKRDWKWHTIEIDGSIHMSAP